MKIILMEWLVLLSAIPAIEGSLKLWKPKSLSVEERVTKKLLETCYEDNDFKDLIFIIGDFNEFIDKASVIRVNNLLNVDEKYEYRRFSSIGVTKVLIIENTPEKLHSELISFNKTRWWNHMLPFFIIGTNDKECDNFREMLNTAWKMDIINSIYICSESENTTLYTLNPITNYAPDPWKRMEDLNGLNIYHQVFDPHVSCNNLNYDKTKVLNGYWIVSSIELYMRNSAKKSSFDAISDYPYHRLIEFITRQINANLYYITKRSSLGHLRYLKEKYSQAKEIESVRLKEGLFSLSIRIGVTFQEVILVKSNEKTVLHKIGHLWSIQVLCGGTIALIILFFILVMKNGEVTSAILDIIRFLSYLSIRTDMRSNSFRIYFVTMLIFIVISNGVFQGKIAAFLTTLDKVPPIKTMEELWDSGYHFYYVNWLSVDLLPGSPSSEHPRVTIVDDNDACIDHALAGTLNACIMPLTLYEEKYLLKPLDCIEPPFSSYPPNSWKSRRNWPLYECFNYMFMRAIEAGIYSKWENEEAYKLKDKHKADDHELALAEIALPYQPIELVKLDFAFRL